MLQKRRDVRTEMAELIEHYKERIEALDYFLSGLPPEPEPLPAPVQKMLYQMLDSSRW